MSSHFRLYSLDVGQGMSTLFVVYDRDGNVTALALFDLGSTKNSKPAGRPTLEFLKNMALQRESPNGRIDAVFVSHKDSDHVNLFFGNQAKDDPLLGLLQLLPDMTIGLARYGGRYSWYDHVATIDKKNTNLLTLLKARTTNPNDDVKGFPVGATSWNPSTATFATALWGSEDYGVFLLAANTPHGAESAGAPENSISEEPNGDQANSKSLVLLMTIKVSTIYYTAVIGGDATYPTFQFINGIYDVTLNNCYMTLLPHHGSRKTTFGLKKSNALISDTNREVVDTFAKHMAGKTVIASADTKHGHPSLDTTQLFLKYADTSKSWWVDPLVGGGRHFTTANIDYALEAGVYNQTGYKTFLTTQNIYSTLYYDTERVSNPMIAYAPFIAFSAAPYNTAFSFSTGMNWVYTLVPQPLDFLIDFRGIASKRLDKDDSLTVRNIEELKRSLTFIHRASGTQVAHPDPVPVPLISPMLERIQPGVGTARAAAHPQRLAPRLKALLPSPRRS